MVFTVQYVAFHGVEKVAYKYSKAVDFHLSGGGRGKHCWQSWWGVTFARPCARRSVGDASRSRLALRRVPTLQNKNLQLCLPGGSGLRRDEVWGEPDRPSCPRPRHLHRWVHSQGQVMVVKIFKPYVKNKLKVIKGRKKWNLLHISPLIPSNETISAVSLSREHNEKP